MLSVCSDGLRLLVFSLLDLSSITSLTPRLYTWLKGNVYKLTMSNPPTSPKEVTTHTTHTHYTHPHTQVILSQF